MKIVLVEWVDSVRYSDQPWFSRDEVANAPLNCTSVGFLLTEDDLGVTIIQGHGGDEVQAPLTIPRCAVTSIRTLDEGDKKEKP